MPETLRTLIEKHPEWDARDKIVLTVLLLLFIISIVGYCKIFPFPDKNRKLIVYQTQHKEVRLNDSGKTGTSLP